MTEEKKDIVSDRFTENDAKKIIKAWDWIPDGNHTVETAQVWVSEKLKPVIEEIRHKLYKNGPTSETLLIKYMRHVRDCEGIDFVEHINSYKSDVIFTDEEERELIEYSSR